MEFVICSAYTGVSLSSSERSISYGVSADQLASDVGQNAVYLDSFASAAEYVAKNAKCGDIVIVMGAGDVYHVFDYLKLDEK